MMYKLRNFLKIIRLPNLLFVVLIQFLMRQSVILPLMYASGVNYHSNWLIFCLLVLASILIAAGGYVINDYYDLKIDTINKPDKMIVGRAISKAAAMRIYQVLSFSGLFIGLLVAWQLKSTTLALLFVLIVGLLWFYSTSYKRQFLVGNIVVAFLASMTVLIVALFEILHPIFDDTMLIINPILSRNILIWVGGFAAFSFLLTLIREMVKDMEDEYGDRQLECRTLPIVLGFNITKIIVIALIIITIGSLLYINNFIHFEGTLTLRYVIFGLILPLLFVIYLIIRAKNKNDYHQASNFMKFIMLIGVLYSLVFHYLMALKTSVSFFYLF